MKNPNNIQFPPNQTQHNPEPVNAGRNASTLPETEFGEFEIRAQAQLPRNRTVARGAIVKAKALALDLNVLPELYECVLCQKTYDKKEAICGHMMKHRYRPWKGLKPPPTWVPFDLNEVPKDEDSEI